MVLLNRMDIKYNFLRYWSEPLIADDIAVSSVSHRAKVIVDENGTKAAAVTDIMIAGTAAMETEETHTFIVDRPFVYVIEDQDTGMILFVGRGNDLVK